MAKWNDEIEDNEKKETLESAVIPTLKEKEEIAQVTYTELPYKDDVSNNLSLLQQNLSNCMRIIDDEVMKGYVTRLEQLPVAVPLEDIATVLPDVQFFRISELVYQEDEFSVHKLSAIFHSLSNRPCTLILMIKSDGDKSDFYLGVRSLNLKYSSGRMRQMIENSLKGLFPGSKIEPYRDEELRADMENIVSNSVSSVTCVADYKQDKDSVKNEDFIQGLEKFVDSMRGKEYTAVFLADSLNYDELNRIKSEYESIYTQISPFANMQFNLSTNISQSDSDGVNTGASRTKTTGVTFGEGTIVGDSKTFGTSESLGVTETSGTSDSVSDGTSESTSVSDGTSFSTSESHTEGQFQSTSVGDSTSITIPIINKTFDTSINHTRGTSSSDTDTVTRGKSHTDTVSNSISKTLTHGINNSLSDSRTTGTSESDTKSLSYNRQISDNYSDSEAFNWGTTKSLTETFGSSQTITLNAKNMTLNSVMHRLEGQLERIEQCESLGMWRFAAYFIGESAAETETAANTYHSIMLGNRSGIERSAVNTWSDENPDMKYVVDYICNFCHPRFFYDRYTYDGNEAVLVDATAMVSTNELALHMGLPRYSVKGLPVVEHAIFAQEVLSRNKNDREKMYLGNVSHLGEETATKIELDIKSLTMHAFVTGSTGAGKSNTIYHILKEVGKKGIPFLVVEPAKGEYKKVFPNVKCYGTNPNIGRLIQINPFSFPKEVHVLEHIDRLVEIFNVCWPMYAAMPAVLKESIERAYIVAGWDMDISVNTKLEGLFPTFDDVLTELNNTIKSSAYSADTKGDYIGSLSTRIKSLTNGINGKIFVGDEMDMSLLFDESAILDISRVGSMETKALIMGLVVLKLQEYRMANATGMNSDLRHITVLEEAHNILKKTSTEQSAESSNLQGKSVEMLTNTIAEIRTYGEGFIIVDQAPNLLDTAAIRNTNTKIVMRLPEGNDREITGKSMALEDEQIVELSKLETGIAAVYQNDWQEAVLCKIPYFNEDDNNAELQEVVPVHKSMKEFNNSLLHMLLRKTLTDNEIEQIKKDIFKSNMSAKIRLDLIQNIRNRNNIFEWAVADFIKKNYDFSDVFRGTGGGNCKTYSELANVMIQNIESSFEGFDKNEMHIILYYICRIQHELFPKNDTIEKLRTNYLKKELS